MRLAAIETATAATAVAVGEDDDVDEVLADDRRRHTEALAPCLAAMLTARGWAVADLDVVVVDVGPGLFTGLRVGVATAKGLGVASGVGLVAVTSTDVLAQAACDAGVTGTVLAVVDVRRGEVVVARHRCGPDGATELDAPALGTPVELAQRLAPSDERAVAVGDGAARYREELGVAGRWSEPTSSCPRRPRRSGSRAAASLRASCPSATPRCAPCTCGRPTRWRTSRCAGWRGDRAGRLAARPRRPRRDPRHRARPVRRPLVAAGPPRRARRPVAPLHQGPGRRRGGRVPGAHGARLGVRGPREHPRDLAGLRGPGDRDGPFVRGAARRRGPRDPRRDARGGLEEPARPAPLRRGSGSRRWACAAGTTRARATTRSSCGSATWTRRRTRRGSSAIEGA